MKRFMLLIMLSILLACTAGAGDRTINASGKRTGYSIRSESKTDHFDSRWKRSGHDAIFDSDHERGAN